MPDEFEGLKDLGAYPVSLEERGTGCNCSGGYLTYNVAQGTPCGQVDGINCDGTRFSYCFGPGERKRVCVKDGVVYGVGEEFSFVSDPSCNHNCLCDSINAEFSGGDNDIKKTFKSNGRGSVKIVFTAEKVPDRFIFTKNGVILADTGCITCDVSVAGKLLCGNEYYRLPGAPFQYDHSWYDYNFYSFKFNVEEGDEVGIEVIGACSSCYSSTYWNVTAICEPITESPSLPSSVVKKESNLVSINKINQADPINNKLGSELETRSPGACIKWLVGVLKHEYNDQGRIAYTDCSTGNKEEHIISDNEIPGIFGGGRVICISESEINDVIVFVNGIDEGPLVSHHGYVVTRLEPCGSPPAEKRCEFWSIHSYNESITYSIYYISCSGIAKTVDNIKGPDQDAWICTNDISSAIVYINGVNSGSLVNHATFQVTNLDAKFHHLCEDPVIVKNNCYSTELYWNPQGGPGTPCEPVTAINCDGTPFSHCFQPQEKKRICIQRGTLNGYFEAFLFLGEAECGEIRPSVTPSINPPNISSAITSSLCSSINEAFEGGNVSTKKSFKSDGRGSVKVVFTTFSIPDRFVFSKNGTLLADTGCITCNDNDVYICDDASLPIAPFVLDHSDGTLHYYSYQFNVEKNDEIEISVIGGCSSKCTSVGNLWELTAVCVGAIQQTTPPISVTPFITKSTTPSISNSKPVQSKGIFILTDLDRETVLSDIERKNRIDATGNELLGRLEQRGPVTPPISVTVTRSPSTSPNRSVRTGLSVLHEGEKATVLSDLLERSSFDSEAREELDSLLEERASCNNNCRGGYLTYNGPLIDIPCAHIKGVDCDGRAFSHCFSQGERKRLCTIDDSLCGVNGEFDFIFEEDQDCNIGCLCNSINKSFAGGNETIKKTFKSDGEGTVKVVFTSLEVPDRFIFTKNGVVLADTGCVTSDPEMVGFFCRGLTYKLPGAPFKYESSYLGYYNYYSFSFDVKYGDDIGIEVIGGCSKCYDSTLWNVSAICEPRKNAQIGPPVARKIWRCGQVVSATPTRVPTTPSVKPVATSPSVTPVVAVSGGVNSLCNSINEKFDGGFGSTKKTFKADVSGSIKILFTALTAPDRFIFYKNGIVLADTGCITTAQNGLYNKCSNINYLPPYFPFVRDKVARSQYSEYYYSYSFNIEVGDEIGIEVVGGCEDKCFQDTRWGVEAECSTEKVSCICDRYTLKNNDASSPNTGYVVNAILCDGRVYAQSFFPNTPEETICVKNGSIVGIGAFSDFKYVHNDPSCGKCGEPSPLLPSPSVSKKNIRSEYPVGAKDSNITNILDRIKNIASEENDDSLVIDVTDLFDQINSIKEEVDFAVNITPTISSSITPSPSKFHEICSGCEKSKSITPSISVSPTPSVSLSHTVSESVSKTISPSLSQTPSITPSISVSPSTSTPTVIVPTNVDASDGLFVDYVHITWNGGVNNYYNIYRVEEGSSQLLEIGSWQTETSYDDHSVNGSQVYFYFIIAASNIAGDNNSGLSVPDDGWASAANSPSVTPSVSSSVSKTPTITPSESKTPSVSISGVTQSITPSSSETPSITPSISITASITPSISESPSITPSNSETPSVSTSEVTKSVTPSVSVSISETPSITPTVSESISISVSVSESISVSVSASVGACIYDVPYYLISNVCIYGQCPITTGVALVVRGDNCPVMSGFVTDYVWECDIYYKVSGGSTHYTENPVQVYRTDDRVGLFSTFLENVTEMVDFRKKLYYLGQLVLDVFFTDYNYRCFEDTLYGYPSCLSYPSLTPSVSSSISITPSITESQSITPSISISSSVSETPSITSSISESPSITSSITTSISASSSETPSITPSISASSSETPSITPSISITPSETPSITVSVTEGIPASDTPSVTTSTTVTPSISVSSSETPSITPSISESPSITPSITPSNSKTPSITPSITSTPDPSPSITKSISRSPSKTPSITPSKSITPSITPSISRSPSKTPSITPSRSITPSITPSITKSISITPSITPSNSKTPSITPSITPSKSKTPSITPSITKSISRSSSITPSISKTPSKTPSVSPSVQMCNCITYSVTCENGTCSLDANNCDGTSYHLSMNLNDNVEVCLQQNSIQNQSQFTIGSLAGCGSGPCGGDLS